MRRPMVILLLLALALLIAACDQGCGYNPGYSPGYTGLAYQVRLCDGTILVVRNMECEMSIFGRVGCCDMWSCPRQFGCVLELQRMDVGED